MPKVTLENVPQGLYDRLLQAARRNRRGISEEVLQRLGANEAYVESSGTAAEEEALMREINASRAKLAERGIWLSAELLREARDEGRP